MKMMGVPWCREAAVHAHAPPSVIGSSRELTADSKWAFLRAFQISCSDSSPNGSRLNRTVPASVKGFILV